LAFRQEEDTVAEYLLTLPNVDVNNIVNEELHETALLVGAKDNNMIMVQNLLEYGAERVR
jgi:hypothetical protein